MHGLRGEMASATDHAAGINYETSAIPQERRGGYRDYWMAADVLEFTSHGYNGYVYNADNERVPFRAYRADCINNFAIDFLHGRKEQTEPFFFCSSARSSRIIRMTVGGMKGPTARGRSCGFSASRDLAACSKSLCSRARTSAIGGKIIRIIWVLSQFGLQRWTFG